MGTFLFDKIVFGPVFSRRLGQSLGINLLPFDSKICTFNCIYCECGWTKSSTGSFHSPELVADALEQRLKKLLQNNEHIDVITFAGNGEPTMHPRFEQIVEITIKLRNKYFPETQIAVLTNSTTLDSKSVFNALMKTDLRIMKLDAGSENMFRRLNNPLININLETIVTNLMKFQGNLIIQTLLVKSISEKLSIDNSTTDELQLLGEHLKKINPHTLMLYSIARGTPLPNLQPLTKTELQLAASKLQPYIPNTDLQVF